MSENSMMAGFAIKMDEVNDDGADTLIENFDECKLDEWQWMYDESGYSCIVMLTDYESAYYDDSHNVVSISDLVDARISAGQYANSFPKFKFAKNLDVNGLDAGPEIVFFNTIWYNGAEMGTIFKEKEDE